MFKGDPTKKTQERLQPVVDKVNALEAGMQALSDDELRQTTASLRERVQGGAALDDVLPEAFAVRSTDMQVSEAFAGSWRRQAFHGANVSVHGRIRFALQWRCRHGRHPRARRTHRSRAARAACSRALQWQAAQCRAAAGCVQVAREASVRALGLRPFDVQIMGACVLHEGCVAEMRTGEGKTLVAVLPALLNALSGKGVHVVTVNDYLARRDSEWVGQVHKFLGLSVGLIQAVCPPPSPPLGLK